VVERSRIAPATKGNMEYRRKPTISWAFVLFQPISTGLSTGLSGLFIGTYSTLAYAAYARVRGASGPHAAPLRQRFGPAWACIGQPYACPMQLPYSTFAELALRVHGPEPVVATSWRGAFCALDPTAPTPVSITAVLPIPDWRRATHPSFGTCRALPRCRPGCRAGPG
jgi:hypothetical protein